MYALYRVGLGHHGIRHNEIRQSSMGKRERLGTIVEIHDTKKATIHGMVRVELFESVS